VVYFPADLPENDEEERFMKVVLFCGGLGMRLREYSDRIPKPMVPIGYRPILWHVMRYYAHFGHKDFVICLGYRSDVIKNYFLNYDECLSNDFVLSEGGGNVELLNRDIADWKITFVETGTHTNIGGRLMAVREHLEGEELFLANYADGLSDLPLDTYLESFAKSQAVAKFVAVRPSASVHIVDVKDDGLVAGVRAMTDGTVRINGGFFAFRREIFDYIRAGEEIIAEPFQRLIGEQRLLAEKYDGFWISMDTFKDRQVLEDLYSRGQAPWELWKRETLSEPLSGETKPR
jgi:glucose-1-phosphate cytidylyltransferase